MLISMNNINANISINDQKLEEVTSFQYLGTTLCKDGTCSAELSIRVDSAMVRLNRIWLCKTIGFASKFKLYKFYIIFCHSKYACNVCQAFLFNLDGVRMRFHLPSFII